MKMYALLEVIFFQKPIRKFCSHNIAKKHFYRILKFKSCLPESRTILVDHYHYSTL